MINKTNWIEWLNAKGLSERTIKDYSFWFSKLDFSKISKEYLVRWIGRYNNSVARAMLKNLFLFIKTGDSPQEIKEFVEGFEIPKHTGRKKQRVLQILDIKQVHQLADAIGNERLKYMILTTFYLGLRCSELLSLNLDSFDWEKSIVRIIGKGNKERVLPVIPQLKDRLVIYFNKQIELNPEIEKCFPIGKRYWEKKLSEKSEKILKQKVNPHLLRHSCGSYLHQRGLSLKEIADFLGHVSVNTTQIYVQLNKVNLNSRVLNAFS